MNIITETIDNIGYVIKPFGSSYGCKIVISFTGEISFSSNRTIYMNKDDLAEVRKAVNDGLKFMQPYIAKGKTTFGNSVAKQKIKPEVGGVYLRKNGRIFIYLGYGVILVDGVADNRSGCRRICFQTLQSNFISAGYMDKKFSIKTKLCDWTGLDTRVSFPNDIISCIARFDVNDAYELNITNSSDNSVQKAVIVNSK